MGYRSDVAFVLWKPDFEELVRKMYVVDRKWADYLEENAKYMTTPDEVYVKSDFECIKWYEEYDFVSCITNFLSEVRHSFVRIGEDIDDVEHENIVEDKRGIDEEFYTFLDVENNIIDYDFVPDIKDERKAMVTEVAQALDNLYKVVGKHRKENSVRVYVDDTDNECIGVDIGGRHYKVNIECDSASAMVSDVVNQTIAKI